MSTLRTPHPGVMCALLIIGTFGIMSVAWFLANVIDAVCEIYETLQGAW